MKLISSQGVDNTGDVYRATYTAFRCSSVSGSLGALEKMQVGTRDRYNNQSKLFTRHMRGDFINAGPNRWLSLSHFFIIFIRDSDGGSWLFGDMEPLV